MAVAQIGATVGDMTHDTPHAGTARDGIAAERLQSPFPWPPVLLVAAAGGGYLLGRYEPIAWPGLDDRPAHWIGLGFGIVGLILITIAVATLMRHKTTVMPHQPSQALVTSGPYARFRNPIYLGETLCFLGAAELTKNIWYAAAALAFAFLVTILQIVHEERHLEARFGDAYRDYKARSRRWI
jgi:protein-S-isoprenylcysteine O-methyltransferase Ste14